MINSQTNAQVKEIVKLQKNAKHRKEKQQFAVEGLKLVREAVFSGNAQKIYVAESFLAQEEKTLSEFFDRKEAETVADEVFAAMSDTVTPQGILALCTMPVFDGDEIFAHAEKNVLFLDAVRDPGNVGTILRTAEGAGIAGVILSADCADVFNPKAVRSTMGSVFRLPFCYTENLAGEIKQMKKNGYKVYATVTNGKYLYDRVDYQSGTGVVIGNEANGISPEVMSAVTDTVRIPMEGNLESLNASVSAGIVLYEAVRQRASLLG